MCEVVSSYNILSKEHNGDYLSPDLIREKFSLGLNAINIAPEFGQLETKIYVKAIKKQNPDLLDVFWEICFSSESGRSGSLRTLIPIKTKKR